MKQNLLFLPLLLALLVIGCTISEEERDRLVEEEYLRKAEILQTERAEVCKKEALWRAEAIADSIIRKLRLDPLNENQYRPPVPERPEYVPTDSSAVNTKRSVKPILNSSKENR